MTANGSYAVKCSRVEMVKQALASVSSADILNPNNNQIEICGGTLSEVFSLDKERPEVLLTNKITEQEQNLLRSFSYPQIHPFLPSCSLKGEQNVFAKIYQ
jgi:hypothetical protein